MFNHILRNAIIGASVAIFTGMLIENYDDTTEPLKIFAFLWAAPILLFVPIYVSYYKGIKYVKEFLYHAMLGCCISLTMILTTLFISNFNLVISLFFNLIVSYIFVWLYFEYKIYKRL